MPEKPLISVCMPVYNAEKDIANAINSILSQTCQNFEIIISDNCSKDRTIGRIKSFRDARIRLLRNRKNIGWRLNSNRVLKEARGKYVVTLHDDDIFFPDYLDFVAKIFGKHRDIGVIHCVPKKVKQRFFHDKTVMKPEEYYSLIASLRYMPAPTVTAYRKNVIKNTGYYAKNHWTGEARLSLEIAKKGYNAYFEGRMHCRRYSGGEKDTYNYKEGHAFTNFADYLDFYKEFRNDKRIKKQDLKDLKKSIVHIFLILYNYNLKLNEKEIKNLFIGAEKEVKSLKDFNEYRLRILIGKITRFLYIKTRISFLYKSIFNKGRC